MKIEEGNFITESVIDALISNPNLEEVSLGSSSSPFILTENAYLKFKNSNIKKVVTTGVEDILAEKFDPLIGYNVNRNLIGYSNYEKLINNAYFSFTKPLTNEELSYLRLIKKDAEIHIDFDDFKNVFEIINILRTNGHTGHIDISIKEKNKFNEYLFSSIGDIKYTDNIDVNLVGKVHDLLTYMKYEKKLIDLILPAINLSPFEKYLFAYNVAKKFKKYKENEEDKTSARDLYQIMDNDFMVCVGYSVLLGDLLDKLGIENYDYSVNIDTGLDDIPLDATVLPDFIEKKDGTKVEVMTESGGHARRMVNLVDPKYGIEGFYIADPTWDNEMEKDAYNHALMTIDEYVAIDRYNYFSIYGISELFFSHSLEEFYQKINLLINKSKNKEEKDIISSLLFCFKELDYELYSSILEKYPEIEKYSFKFTTEIIQDVFLEIGERIVSRSNNIVGGDLFKEGITALYRDCYAITDSEELDRTVNEVMEYNKKRHELCFPTRYKIDKNDNRLVLFNLYNKFDVDGQPKLGI